MEFSHVQTQITKGQLFLTEGKPLAVLGITGFKAKKREQKRFPGI